MKSRTINRLVLSFTGFALIACNQNTTPSPAPDPAPQVTPPAEPPPPEPAPAP